MTQDKRCTLETERLIMRAFSWDDISAYHEVLGDTQVGRWLPKGEGYTEEEVGRWVAMILEHWQEEDFGVWALINKEDGTFLGDCGLRILEETGEVEILYDIAREEWGKGYATEAARAAIHHGFTILGLERIIGLTKPANRPSQRVLEKIGLRYLKTTPYFGFDCSVYEMTKTEFQDRSSPET